MDSFAPLINLLTLLGALSIAAERITNIAKSLDERMMHRVVIPQPPGENATAEERAAFEKKLEKAEQDKRTRELEITRRAALHGVLLAVVLKADIFAIMHRLDAPWTTLGWFHYEGGVLVRAAEVGDAMAAVFAIIGCVVTGISLGFGSNFWHGLLGIVLDLRERQRELTKRLPKT